VKTPVIGREESSDNTSSNASSKTSRFTYSAAKVALGKSLISAIFLILIIERGRTVPALNADPVNQTLSEYQGLAVRPLIS